MFKKISLLMIILIMVIGQYAGAATTNTAAVDPEKARAYGNSTILDMETINHVAGSTVKLMVEYEKEGKLYRAASTGFFVANDYLVTNYHVIKEIPGYTITRIYVTYTIDNQSQDIIASVLDMNKYRDFALLYLERSKYPDIGSDFLTFAQDQKSEKVAAIGFPDSRESLIPFIDEGTITDEVKDIAEIRQELGNSGSPIVNSKGEVVGVSRAIVRNLDGTDTGITQYVDGKVVGKFIAPYLILAPYGTKKAAVK